MKKEKVDEKCKWRMHNFVKDDNSCCMKQMRHQSEPDLRVVSSYKNLVFSFYDSSSGLPFFSESPFCRLPVNHYHEIQKFLKTMTKNAIFQNFPGLKKAPQFLKTPTF